jgi:hypothetical protein
MCFVLHAQHPGFPEDLTVNDFALIGALLSFVGFGVCRWSFERVAGAQSTLLVCSQTGSLCSVCIQLSFVVWF